MKPLSELEFKLFKQVKAKILNVPASRLRSSNDDFFAFRFGEIRAVLYRPSYQHAGSYGKLLDIYLDSQKVLEAYPVSEGDELQKVFEKHYNYRREQERRKEELLVQKRNILIEKAIMESK